MICNNIIDKYHLFERKNKYIVDTNVLIALFGNKKYNQQINENSKLKKAIENYNKAIDNHCIVYVPAIVLSEFVNLFFNERFNELKSKYPNKYHNFKKDYRNKNEYIKDCNYIKDVIEKQILNDLKPISDDFDKLSIEQMFKFDEDDFNDRLIIHIANINNLYVISADADVKKIKIN